MKRRTEVTSGLYVSYCLLARAGEADAAAARVPTTIADFMMSCASNNVIAWSGEGDAGTSETKTNVRMTRSLYIHQPGTTRVQHLIPAYLYSTLGEIAKGRPALAMQHQLVIQVHKASFPTLIPPDPNIRVPNLIFRPVTILASQRRQETQFIPISCHSPLPTCRASGPSNELPCLSVTSPAVPVLLCSSFPGQGLAVMMVAAQFELVIC